MAVAMMYPKGTQGKRTATSVATQEVDSGSLSHARTVLRALPTVAEEVMAGKKFLDAVYPDAALNCLHQAPREGRGWRNQPGPLHRHAATAKRTAGHG